MRIVLCIGEGNHWDSMNSVYLRVIYLITFLHVVWKRFTVLAVQYHKYNGYFTHQSFKAVSLIRHIVTKYTVAS